MTSNEVATRQAGIVVGENRLSLADLMELSRVMAVSGLVPQDLRGKPADVLLIIMKGQDIGLSPTQALDSIYAIKGRTSLSAHLWVALARNAGHMVTVENEDGQSCTVTVTRHDDPRPVSVTYTLADAKQADLLKNDNYRKSPKDMLYARAASKAVRRACPEVALGFSDEYEDAQPERPSLGQVVAEREDRAAEQRAAIAPAPEAVDAETVEPEPAAADIGPTADEYAELANDFERPATEGLFDPGAE